ncbi:MAG: AmmeMemoRadiSam system protein A [Deltaproteobacteria bacterium]|nr:AmmeMemoRadiSam system protein A [Deltaproteobacteria bacterium]
MSKEFKPVELTRESQKEILDWCLEILRASLTGKAPPPGPKVEGEGGVFVTLKKNGELRGCIGVFSWDRPLRETIERMTLAAAFNDHRFPPLTLPELDNLELTISVLTQPKPVANLQDIVIGRDGLYLLHPKSRGVLLPVVAEEYGFTPTQFAEQTSMKAGLPPKAYLDPGAELLVFTAPAFSTADFS